MLKTLAGAIESKLNNGIVLLINTKENSINFVAKENNNLKEAFNVGTLIKDISKIASGNGGGSPTFAQGGGTDPEKLDMILSYVNSALNPYLFNILLSFSVIFSESLA